MPGPLIGEIGDVCFGFDPPAGAPVFKNGGIGLECNSNSFIGGITGSVKGANPGKNVNVAGTCVKELM